MEGRGRALVAAERRCDALIAPSGCGQCPGEEHEHSASGAALTLCQMSSLALMLFYKIWYIRCTHNRFLPHQMPAVSLFSHLERHLQFVLQWLLSIFILFFYIRHQ